MKIRITILAAILASAYALIDTPAQDKQPKKDVIPHAQDKPPGPALTPQEAIKKMQVPPGFHVELVAAEPDIVNPVAMTFDERGRIWITESIEYPRRSAGPGKDRVKLLESTKGDGKFDKITTVIDGLNIPSGIAVGHGGVWVCNAPDILFYPIEDFASAKLGKPQVVVTGFGRYDTHELPNSLTWGPDGWLYGLNGVFNRSVIKQDGKTFDFTCALFRIHPRTKKFEIFCEGTSNPWGLAFNDNGDAFVSACVIDHLWHLTETGYYQRQGGPYPPFTWKIGSIVKHRHQKAAYCGLVWFDSDAYPPEYREKLYMGNIHGGCINADELTRDGSTYLAKAAFPPSPLVGEGPGVRGKEPANAKPQAALGVGPGGDFLVANDAWFMPVAQKVGPDGCMYILDWYDRYHCYQDANRDPAGIDRLRGRLYRVVYKDYKPAGKFDLKGEGSSKLIERLSSPNIYIRETAQRLLTESIMKCDPNDKVTFVSQLRVYLALTDVAKDLEKRQRGVFDDPKDVPKILARNEKVARNARLHAYWALSSSDLFPHDFDLSRDEDPTLRAWAVRASANISKAHPANDLPHIPGLARDVSPEVQLQVAIAARKLKGVDPLPILLDVLTHCGDDKLIPHIVWQNLHPLLEKDGERFLSLAAKADLTKAPGLAKLLPHAIDRILGNASGDPAAVVKFIDKLGSDLQGQRTKILCFNALAVRIQNNELAGKQLDALRTQIVPTLIKLKSTGNDTMAEEAVILLATLKDPGGLRDAAEQYRIDGTESVKLRMLQARITGGDKEIVSDIEELFQNKTKLKHSAEFRGQVLSAISKLDDPRLAGAILPGYAMMAPELQPKAIEFLTQRPSWAKALFTEIAAKRMSKEVVNVNQARKLLATKDKELAKLIEKHWGIPRDSRSPEREKVVAQMKELYKKTPGDPKAGVPIFKKLCAQCHKIYGEGVDVGPDITSNGRSDFDQLLSNIFDPSLVIGAGYQAVTVNTKQGQVISGLLVEDNDMRVVLKVQGGERKTIARADVDEQFTSKVSLMPEDLEKQLRPQEIVDLLAYLSLDRPPEDAKARKIPGTPR